MRSVVASGRPYADSVTVVLCIPSEICNKILDLSPGLANSDIDVADVLHWAVTETWADSRRSMPLWFVQGQRFIKHETARNNMQKDGKTTMMKSDAEGFQEDEAKTVEARYRPSASGTRVETLADPALASNSKMVAVLGRCHEYGSLNFDPSVLQEEQERELAPEIEQQREVQRPGAAKAAPQHLHKDLLRYVRTGSLVAGSDAHTPAFKSLKDTSVNRLFNMCQLNDGGLLVTAGFTSTVVGSGKSFQSDSYQNPVQYLLSNAAPGGEAVEKLLVISQYEAYKLLPDILKHRSVALHIYTPRCKFVYDALDNLDFFTVSNSRTPFAIPSKLRVQLNLFAGQLYFSSYADYLETCAYLGLAAEKTPEGWKVAADGFILSDGQGRVGGTSGLSKSPVNFLKTFLTKIRRDGQGIDKTHMGRLLEGRLLQPSDFDA